jgi:hypothetical protein
MFEFLRRIPELLGLKPTPGPGERSKVAARTDDVKAPRGRGAGRGVIPPTPPKPKPSRPKGRGKR